MPYEMWHSNPSSQKPILPTRGDVHNTEQYELLLQYHNTMHRRKNVEHHVQFYLQKQYLTEDLKVNKS